jgi:signal transduction histidine kinase
MLHFLRRTGEATDLERFLPIADLTAVSLERALLAPDELAAQSEMAAALIADPALLSWSVRLATQQEFAPTTVAETAAWLAQNFVAHFHAPPGNPSSIAAERVAPEEAVCYAAAYTHAVLEARAASHAAGQGEMLADFVNNKAYVSSIVAAADRMLLGESWRKTQDQHDPLGYYFLAEEPAIEWRLPALVAKLAACQQQLADFNRRLEHEKLEALKELAYGASHEINNPLANIAARAQTLLQGENDPERQRKLTAIHRQAMRAHEMIADLMLFARPPKLEPKTCDLRGTVEQIADELSEEAAERQIEIALNVSGETIEVTADATQIAVAIKALVTNSLEAIGAGGHIDISLQQFVAGEEVVAQVTVRDDGPGISENARQHMFDPFFSGREAGRGLGFGLSKCWRIVTDHGGQVVVQQQRRRGTEISLLLPLGGLATPSASY